MEGVRSTGGNFSMCENIGEKTAESIEMLENLGAIPLMRANCPQMYFGNNTNSFWGEGVSPFFCETTIGGSAGGDAALVATECIPFSIAPDFGGCVRAPALFNGVFGFKCS